MLSVTKSNSAGKKDDKNISDHKAILTNNITVKQHSGTIDLRISRKLTSQALYFEINKKKELSFSFKKKKGPIPSACHSLPKAFAEFIEPFSPDHGR